MLDEAKISLDSHDIQDYVTIPVTVLVKMKSLQIVVAVKGPRETRRVTLAWMQSRIKGVEQLYCNNSMVRDPDGGWLRRTTDEFGLVDCDWA